MCRRLAFGDSAYIRWLCFDPRPRVLSLLRQNNSTHINKTKQPFYSSFPPLIYISHIYPRVTRYPSTHQLSPNHNSIPQPQTLLEQPLRTETPTQPNFHNGCLCYLLRRLHGPRRLRPKRLQHRLRPKDRLRLGFQLRLWLVFQRPPTPRQLSCLLPSFVRTIVTILLHYISLFLERIIEAAFAGISLLAHQLDENHQKSNHAISPPPGITQHRLEESGRQHVLTS